MAGLISNGTYVLGTNISEVSVDSSLTGKGTPDSPLGVNETVLWSGNAGNTVGTVLDLTDALTAFSIVRFDTYNLEFTDLHHSCHFKYFNGSETAVNLTEMHIQGNAGSINYTWLDFYIDNDFTTIQTYTRGLLYNKYNSMSLTTGNNRGLGLTKIVGINRTANG